MKTKNFAKIILLLAVIFVFPSVSYAQQYDNFEVCLGEKSVQACCALSQFENDSQNCGLCAKRQFPCAYKCDENTGACIADPNKSNGNGATPGVVGDTCEFPGVQSTCGEGLVCDSNLKCKTNTGSGNNPGGGGTGGGSGDSIPGPNSEWCNNDPNLTYSNGVCLPKDAGFAKTGFAGSTSLSDLMIKIIKFFLTFAGIVGVLILVIGGYWYLSSGGNEETAEKGKKAIINAIIGLVVVILAYTIVTIISSTLIADTFVK